MRFTIHGIPAPQGSKSAYVRGGRAIVVEGNSASGRAKHKAWRTAVTEAAIAARDEEALVVVLNHELFPITGPVHARIDFIMPRPKSAPKYLRWARRKPDIDKLLRSTFDGITDAGVWGDDAQVVSLITTKRLALDGITGALIELYELSETT